MNKFEREVTREGMRQILAIGKAMDALKMIDLGQSSNDKDAKQKISVVNRVLASQERILRDHLKKVSEQSFICSGLVNNN